MFPPYQPPISTHLSRLLLNNSISLKLTVKKSNGHQPCYYSYKLKIEQMASDKNKIVQNYCLDELRYCNPDESEIWTAKHKILKKNFTLKRLKYRGCRAEGENGQKLAGDKEEWDLQNLNRQTDLLKRLNQENCPKCRKMIKTSNNIYLVYEEFPLLNLKEHLTKNHPNRYERLELMTQIAKTVRDYHSLGIVILALSPYNVYLKDKNDVFLADWSLARSKDDTEKIVPSFFTSQYDCLAKEVSQEGTFSASSDMYSLGKIFNKIQHSGYLQSPSSVDNKLHQIINQMTSDRQAQRPTINEVIKIIEDCGKFSKSHSTKSEVSDDKQPQNPSSKTVNSFKIKHTMSTPVEQDDRSDLMVSQKKYSEMPDTPKTFKSNRSSTNLLSDVRSTKTVDAVSQLQLSKRYETKTTYEPSLSVNYSRKINKSRRIADSFDEVIKAANKKRNLAFFLLDLAEFVIRIWICPELGYILLKYSMLTIESIIQEWQPELWENYDGQKFIDIVKNEKEKFQLNLNILRESYEAFEGDELLKRQFDQPKVISERYLKEKIRQFAKQMVLFCEKYLSDKSSLTKLIESLFKTYMILKKIEEGSFEKFWDRIYLNENAFLSNQKYLKDERNLGFRYLKSRIAEILKAK